MSTRDSRKSWMAELAQAARADKNKSAPHLAGRAGVHPTHKAAVASNLAARKGSTSLKPAAKVVAKTAAKILSKPVAKPVPTGVGLTSARLRTSMVERLQASGIRHPAVLIAMGHIERHRFVDEGLASRAYEDSALPIGHEQTISQPYIVARMTELLLAGGPADKVLEIGTGCGYQAAVLSKVVKEVYSIERIRALHDKARANLRPFRLPNLRLVYGDGLLGVPEAAPFDAMLIAAAGEHLPRSLLEQLRIGGRALAPLQGQSRTAQYLCLIIRTGPESWSREELEPVRFVPLLSGKI